MLAAGAEVRDQGEGGDQGGDADRHVDVEDPAPVDVRDDRAADSRSRDGREPGHATPDAERGAAPLWRKDRGQDRERLRRQQRTADALQDAGGDQLFRVLRQSAQRRGDREDAKADREQVALAVKVAETARRDEEHGVHEHIRVQHPQDLVECRVEPGAHRRDRHIDDRGVQHDHEESRGQDQQNQPRVSACARHVSSLTEPGRDCFRPSTPAFRR